MDLPTAGGPPPLQTDEERRIAAQLAASRAANVRDRQHAAFTVVIGEAMLRQQAGGGEAMLGQLGQLVGEPGELPAPVTLQVTSFTAGAHGGSPAIRNAQGRRALP